ncbi:MAG TPA: dihydrofolate reductase family protein [Conexibacter sp.]|jgi:dihydrofolate reductase
MRKLVLMMQVSLDGCVARQDGELEWIFPQFDDGLTEHTLGVLGGASAHLMGAATYRDMAAHWPVSDGPIAALMNEIPKVAFAERPLEATWATTRVLEGGDALAEGITALKREDGDGGYLLAHGGASFARSLIRERLVDEYRLSIHPVAIGTSGQRIFEGPLGLRLTGARCFPAGAVAASYEPEG